MKKVALRDATDSLREYVPQTQKGPIVVMSRGNAVAALIWLRGGDEETLSLSTNPQVMKIINWSRRRYQLDGGISLGARRTIFGIDWEWSSSFC